MRPGASGDPTRSLAAGAEMAGSQPVCAAQG